MFRLIVGTIMGSGSFILVLYFQNKIKMKPIYWFIAGVFTMAIANIIDDFLK